MFKNNNFALKNNFQKKWITSKNLRYWYILLSLLHMASPEAPGSLVHRCTGLCQEQDGATALHRRPPLMGTMGPSNADQAKLGQGRQESQGVPVAAAHQTRT